MGKRGLNFNWLLVILVIVLGLAAVRLDPLIKATADQITQEQDPFEQLMEMRDGRARNHDWLLLVFAGITAVGGYVIVADRSGELLRQVRLTRPRRSRRSGRPVPPALPANVPEMPEDAWLRSRSS